MKDDLVFDVGLHTGDDTDYYLRKGFSVVAIEASPDLVETAKIRFHWAIDRGRLHLIDGAIAPASEGDKVTFYSSTHSDWGTISPAWASRNEMLEHPNEQTEVTRVDIAELYRSYGIPFFLKIDIEGLDRFVLEELKGFQDRPRYVSLESEKTDFSQLKAEMDLLKNLGYKKFKVVQQETIPGMKITTRTLDGQPFEYEFQRYSSGPFGDDLPPPWLTYLEALEEYRPIFRRYKYFGDYSAVRKLPWKVQDRVRNLYRMTSGYGGPLPGWFDTHARLRD
jgi:FkbM family methyltransferase